MVAIKYSHGSDAALCNMMWIIYGNYAGYSRHVCF